MRRATCVCCVMVFVLGLGCKSQELPPPEPIVLEPVPEVSEEVSPAPPRAAPTEPPVVEPPTPAEVTYVVRRGDTLYSIARRFYGDGKLWTLIRDANRDRIPAPELLRVGTELTIPPKP